ncbi:MAG: OsmC family protein [Myxococcota bacterium]
MKVSLKRVGPAAFEATAGSGGQATIDGSPEIGGEGKGMRPMEALLVALASCAAMDVVHILRRQKEPLEDLRIEVAGERADDVVPQPFTRIHMTFTAVGGGLSEKKVKRAVALSVEKYCSVGATLAPAVTVAYQTAIIAP